MIYRNTFKRKEIFFWKEKSFYLDMNSTLPTNVLGTLHSVRMILHTSRWPHLAAMCKAVMPSSPFNVTSAPVLTRYFTTAALPLLAANINGVN